MEMKLYCDRISEMGHSSGLFLAVADLLFQILNYPNNLEGQMFSPDIISAINQSKTRTAGRLHRIR